MDSRGAAATICILPRYRHEISDKLTRAAFSVLLVANWPICCDITSSFGKNYANMLRYLHDCQISARSAIVHNG